MSIIESPQTRSIHSAKPIADQCAREEALNSTQSFIVQAPAGSGKTELLTQRFLRLLSTVNTPEEIIAITFTRKAAGEMRERILSALRFAHNHPEPNAPHQANTWKLAKQALAQDHLKKWSLRKNPNRLRVLTIDALSASLCAQIPLLSEFGAQPKLVEDATPYYEQAVKTVLLSGDYQADVETLLLHLDNKIEQCQSLLMRILASRDQWLVHMLNDHATPDTMKKNLEKGLVHIALENMQRTKSALPDALETELLTLAQFAGHYLQENNPTHPISACAELKKAIHTDLNDFPLWKGIAHLLLTKENQWRKSVDKRCGFPATDKNKDATLTQHYKDNKARFLKLLKTISESESCRKAFANIAACPPLQYTQQQWKIIQALTHLLPLLAAQLRVIFTEQGVIDFVELTLGALRALGDPSQPTDLALYLDDQIQHLLIDEFQDTSVIQFHLIEQLITDWQPSDGRTLFLVGDPMQSIYRFRNAEVGLFLRAQQQGIANLSLQPLTLQTNFRSNATIVNWINAVFKNIFPNDADMNVGAVPYSAATAMQNNNESTVQHYPLIQANGHDEAQQIIAIINQCQQKDPSGSIAILVRSRYQLADITPALLKAQIPYQAIEIETLAHRMEVQDCVTLTRALLHLGDRIAWLALLRAPWCGLTLADLLIITEAADNRPLWTVLANYNKLNGLSDDAHIRLQRMIPILAHTLHHHGRLPLALWLQGAWTALGGPACLHDASEINNVNTYFKLLETLEYEFSFEVLDNKLARLYAESKTNDNAQCHIMTIHKAKGLEFDHVILPNLDRKTPQDKSQLLMWLERPTLSGENDLILAPIKATHETNDPIFDYLRSIEKNKLHYEIARLLYVATTRTKSSLHLISHLEEDPEDPAQPKKPAKGSFFELLWSPCYQAIQKTIKKVNDTNHPSLTLINNENNTLTRLVRQWQSPVYLTPSPPIIENGKETNQPDIFSKNHQQHVGTVIHEALECIANEEISQWTQERIQSMKVHWQRRLMQLGLSDAHLNASITLVLQAINNTLNDPKGQWILSNQQEQQNEFALTALIDETPTHFIIDRTFVEQGKRWIIDYKTAIPSNESLEAFLKRQQQAHKKQLNQYAQAFTLIKNQPICCGLYFPLVSAWAEWEPF